MGGLEEFGLQPQLNGDFSFSELLVDLDLDCDGVQSQSSPEQTNPIPRLNSEVEEGEMAHIILPDSSKLPVLHSHDAGVPGGHESVTSFRAITKRVKIVSPAEKIRTDERVTIIERSNLRYLQELPQNVDLVMPAVVNLMKMESTLITLVKPQFEARRSQVGGGGIVRDPQVHQEVLERIIKGVEEFGFKNEGWIESPIKGAERNIEFLACFHRVPMAQ